MSGRLVLGGVPLGNVADASPRLAEALRTADVVAAEDTRRLHRLAADLDVAIGGRVVSYFDGNEAARTPPLVADLRAGATVLLVTDGGMPSVSDPGYRLVAATIAANTGTANPDAAGSDAGGEPVAITVLPGPSAVTAALAVSGMPCDRFCFEGFPPRRPAERRRTYAGLVGEPRTIVLFESPHRLASSLADLSAALGAGRPAALCRELTKTYEQVHRGTLGELSALAETDAVRGEITLVIAGAPDHRAPADSASATDAARDTDASDSGTSEPAPPAAGSPVATPTGGGLAAAVARTEAAGIDRKAAIAAVAAVTGTRKRDVYSAVVAAKSPPA